MNILTTSFTANRLFTFVREGMMYVEFNSVTLFPIRDGVKYKKMHLNTYTNPF